MDASALTLGVLAPAVAAGVSALIGWRSGSGTDSSARGSWGVSLGLAAGFALAYAAILGWPPFPPIEASQWLVFLSGAAVALAVVEAWVSPGPASRWALRCVLIAALIGLMCKPLMLYTWGWAQAILWLSVIGLVVIGIWIVHEHVATFDALTGWLTLWLVATGAAVALALTGSLALGQLAGALAAGLGGAAVASLIAGGRAFPSTAVAAGALVLSGLLIAGYFYSELPASSALILAVAPLARHLAPTRLTDGRSPRVRSLIETLPVAVAIAIAVAMTLVLAPATNLDYGY